jgi:hypothetical protein
MPHRYVGCGCAGTGAAPQAGLRLAPALCRDHARTRPGAAAAPGPVQQQHPARYSGSTRPGAAAALGHGGTRLRTWDAAGAGGTRSPGAAKSAWRGGLEGIRRP